MAASPPPPRDTVTDRQVPGLRSSVRCVSWQKFTAPTGAEVGEGGARYMKNALKISSPPKQIIKINSEFLGHICYSAPSWDGMEVHYRFLQGQLGTSEIQGLRS